MSRGTATVTNTKGVDNTVWTTAQLTTWANAISAALVTTGLVRTADTGQTETAAMVAPAQSGNTTYPVGYQVYTLPAAAGMPTLYIRFDFLLTFASSGGQYNSHLALTITTGDATDGAGGITTNRQSFIFHTYYSSGSAYAQTGPMDWLFSASSSHFTAYMGDSLTQGQGFFSLERTRSSVGVVNAVGYIIATSGYRSLSSYYANFVANTQTSISVVFAPVAYGGAYALTSYTYMPYPMPFAPFNTSARTAGDFNAFGYFVALPTPQGSGVGLLGCWQQEVVGGTEYDVTLYGTSRHYFATKHTLTGAPFSAFVSGLSAPNPVRMLLRME